MKIDEIKFFDKISDSWDDNETLSTPKVIRNLLSLINIDKGASILDLGTGTGVLIPFLEEAVGPEGNIVAIDFSEGMLNKAISKFGSFHNVEFLHKDFEDQPVEGRFDFIFLYCVFPHLHSPEETLKSLISHNLKPGGVIIISFPTDEVFVNNIHKEKKADSDLLPSANQLSARLLSWGINAKVVSASNPYMVIITR